MKAQRKWVWGEYEEKPKYFVFKSDAVGGYRCKLCGEELCRRWDALQTHLTRQPHNMMIHRVKKSSLKIPEIKERCKVCDKALNPHSVKMKRHLRKGCKGPIEGVQEAGDEEAEGEHEEVQDVVEQREDQPDEHADGALLDEVERENIPPQDFLDYADGDYNPAIEQDQNHGVVQDDVLGTEENVPNEAEEQEIFPSNNNETDTAKVKYLEGIVTVLQENIYQDTKIYETKLMEMKNKMEKIVREKEEDAKDYLNFKKSVEEQEENSITERKLLYLKTLDMEKELKILQEKNDDKEKDIKNLMKENKELTEKNRKLQEEVGSMKREKDELTEDFENRVEKVIEDLNEVVKITEKEKDKVTKENITLDDLDKQPSFSNQTVQR